MCTQALGWKTGGTIQIGIGSLSEALVNALLIRHKNTLDYNTILSSLDSQSASYNSFTKGLYGLTEMLTDGFMHLRKAGFLNREVVDDQSGLKTYLHGSFFLGSQDFYNWLNEMPHQEKHGLRMTRVSKVNDIYDPNETLLRKQRIKARFFNTTMQVTLLGDAISETLADGSVVSGVGGQYNFVAMSQELKDARSVLLLRSTRTNSKGRTLSNIVWTGGHVTIPRHLRDVVVTEYGIADLKGKSDEECVEALLNITDSRFQDDLLLKAKKAKKIKPNYKIPKEYTLNTSEGLKSKLTEEYRNKYFKPFALGSDFTLDEERLLLALQELKSEKQKNIFRVLRALLSRVDQKPYAAELKRMRLDQPSTLRDLLQRKLLVYYLTKTSQQASH